MKKILFSVFTLAVLAGVCFGETSDKTVRIAYLQNALDHLACFVALEKRFFAQQGVEVEIPTVYKAGPELMGAFISGKLDMAYVGEAPATTAVANNAANVVVVAQANTEGSALVVARKTPGITKVSELEGKSVAIPGYSTVQDFLLRRTLKNNGIELQKVKITVVKPPQMINALKSGQIDAFIAWSPYPSEAVLTEVGRNLITARYIWKDHPCCVLVSDATFLKDHPEKVKAVVRAHVQATDFIHQNMDEALQISSKYLTTDIAAIRDAMSIINLTYNIAVDGEKEYVQYLSELGYIKVKDPAAFTDAFINTQILKEVLEHK